MLSLIKIKKRQPRKRAGATSLSICDMNDYIIPDFSKLTEFWKVGVFATKNTKLTKF
jgi:hypothetical protein